MPRRRRLIDEIGALARRIYVEQLAPTRERELEDELRDEPEPVPPFVRGRPLFMARRIRPIRQDPNHPGNQRTPSQQIGRKIYHWPIVGGTEVAGMHAKYTVILWSTGELSCDCPGWIHYFRHKGDTACKHSKARDETRHVIFQMWQAGEALPQQTQEHDEGVVVHDEVRGSSTQAGMPRGDSRLILGRIIDT